MSHYDKEFKRFAKGRFGRKKFRKFIILGLMMFLALGILSSAFGGRGRHRHAHHYNSEGRGHHSQQDQRAANAPQSNQAAQANQANQTTQAVQSNVPNEMLVLSNALVRSVQNRHITQEQADAIIAQELREMMENNVTTASAPVEAPQPAVEQSNQAPQAGFEFNRGDQAPQSEFNRDNRGAQEGFRGEYRRDRRHHGFFPIAFIIGGLFKLALLFFLLKMLSRFLGFKPWKRARAGYRSARAGYEGWAEHEETPVDPLDDEIFKEEMEKEAPVKEESAAETKNEAAPKQEASPEPATVILPKEEGDSQANNAQAAEKDDNDNKTNGDASAKEGGTA